MVTPEALIHRVCRVTGIPYAKMAAPRGTRVGVGGVVRMRQAIMFVLYKNEKLSYPIIGRKLGGMDHSAIMHGCTRIRDLLQYGDAYTRRSYRVAIRAYVTLKREEEARRVVLRAEIARMDVLEAA